MPKSQESLNQDLDDLLTGRGYEVRTLDSSGKEVPVPDEAEVFQFHFHKDGNDYGTVTASIDGLKNLTIYYDDLIADSGKVDESHGDGTSWLSLVKRLKKFALTHQLGFQLKDTDRLGMDMKRRIYQKKLEESKQLAESYYGNKKMSYSDDTPTIKMVIKHSKQIEETDQRFRNIEKIFLETSNGERFAVSTNKPSRARMFARHLAEGGEYKDDRWAHLQEICEDLDVLSGFVRATRNGIHQFNESASRIINEAAEQYHQLRETVKRLQSSRGYNNYFESYQPRVLSETDDNLSQFFQQNSIDSRIERALPVLSKFNITTSVVREGSMLEEWADGLLDEMLHPNNDRQQKSLIDILSDDVQLGPNANVAIAEISDVLENDELNNRLRKAAKIDPNRDAAPIIIAWMQEQSGDQYKDILANLDDKDGGVQQPPEPAPEPPTTPENSEEKGKEAPQKDDVDLPPLPPLKENGDIDILRRLSGL